MMLCSTKYKLQSVIIYVAYLFLCLVVTSSVVQIVFEHFRA